MGAVMSCAVCGTRTFKTRSPQAFTCKGCGKQVCGRHIHFRVDGQNIAITRSAPPLCATCARMVTIHCFWRACSYIVEHSDPVEGSRIMQAHYDAEHEDDLAALGYEATA